MTQISSTRKWWQDEFDQPEIPAIGPTRQIVEGVMTRLLGEIGRAMVNAQLGPWGPEWDADFCPLVCGSIRVEIEDFEHDQLLHIKAFNTTISTWIDSKRPFYHAHLPRGFTDSDLLHWAQLAFAETDRVNHELATLVIQGKADNPHLIWRAMGTVSK